MIGNFLLQIAAHDKITSIILAIEYSMLIIHSYYESGWFGFLVMASTCLVGIISTRKYVSFSLFHQPDFQVSTTEERNRILTSMVLFSIRFFMQQQNRILLMPMYILIMITTNTLCKQLFWALLPIYYVSLHFVASCIYNVIQFGLNSETIPLCFDYIAIAMAIVLLSNYMIKTSMNLQSKVKTLEETRLKLENALAAKQTFLRHISHEFRSPCLSSLGSLELLRETDLTEHQRDLVDTIAASDGILLNLIEDVLTLVKIEHESQIEHHDGVVDSTKYFQEFSLGHCVKMIGKIVKSYCKQFDVGIKVQIDDNTRDVFVRANQTRIHQIISNLMTNAVKASKKGDNVELICSTVGEIRTVNGIQEQNVMFKVIDHGIGIPKSKQRTIFEPFAQLHNINERIYRGSGLGLNTVLHNVSAMHGTIELKSELNEGAEFTVILPLEVITNADKNDLKDKTDIDPTLQRQLSIQANYLKLFASTEELSSEKKNAKIIIADDNAVNRKVILKLIESIGYEADCVSDGKQLLDNLDINRHQLVITDMNMPVLDGREAARIIKGRFPKEKIKIVALTGDIMTDSSSELFDQVIMKPCHKAILKLCIEQFVSN
nr:unnamed protein product [Naegleria fowleri]